MQRWSDRHHCTNDHRMYTVISDEVLLERQLILASLERVSGWHRSHGVGTSAALLAGTFRIAGGVCAETICGWEAMRSWGGKLPCFEIDASNEGNVWWRICVVIRCFA